MILDGEHLTLEQVVEVAYGEAGAPKVVLGDDSQIKVKRAAQGRGNYAARRARSLRDYDGLRGF